MLSELDGFQSLKDVRLICATNYPNELSAPFVRRFSKFIHVPMPDLNARQQAVALNLQPIEPHKVDTFSRHDKYRLSE